jgi:VWFA-related protein
MRPAALAAIRIVTRTVLEWRPMFAPRILLASFLAAANLFAQQTSAPAPAAASAQEAPPSPGPQATISVQTTLVEVPALVKTKDGEQVFALTADDFLLTDDGVPQHLSIEPDTDSRPLALAIVVETGGLGASHLADYRRLDPILDALIGNVEHRVAVISFDSIPHLAQPFSPETSYAAQRLALLKAGDPGAAILDAVAFAVGQLRTQPDNYRRAILLLSETVDQGSNTSRDEALRLISDTNTTMYSFGFSSTRAAVGHEASKFSQPDHPGPAHGCFSREGADTEYDGHYSKQVLDCLSILAPPIRLATMAFLTARNSLRTNTAESVAQLTGGEFHHFKSAKDLQAGLIATSNDVPNFYVLSFHPTSPTPGLHVLHLKLKDRPQLSLHARSEYWIDETTPAKQ